MRLRTHLLVSVAAGIALYPRAPHRAALLALSGVAIDLDHYFLYALRSGDWNPVGAVHYYRQRNRPARRGDALPDYGPLRSIVHRPTLTIPLVWLLGRAWPALYPLAVGVTLHLLMDIPLLGLDWRVWRRAGGRCERCGRGGLELGVYYVRSPRRGGSRWALNNRAAWCRRCAREVYTSYET
jgi:hypothetical protein